METSAAILPAHPARLPGLPASRSDGDLGGHPSGASCPPSRPLGQPVRWRPRQLVIRHVPGDLLPSIPPAPTDTSPAGLPARPARLPGPPASRSDGDLGSHPSSSSCPPSRSLVQLYRRTPRQLVIRRIPGDLWPSGFSAQIYRRRARPPVFRRLLGALQAFRPVGPMETSPAGDPAAPGHRSGLPSGSTDGDLGSHPSSGSWTPSRPLIQLRRWRPRQPVIRRLLGALSSSSGRLRRRSPAHFFTFRWKVKGTRENDRAEK